MISIHMIQTCPITCVLCKHMFIIQTCTQQYMHIQHWMWWNTKHTTHIHVCFCHIHVQHTHALVANSPNSKITWPVYMESHLVVHTWWIYTKTYNFQSINTCILIPSCVACQSSCTLTCLVICICVCLHLFHLLVIGTGPAKFDATKL